MLKFRIDVERHVEITALKFCYEFQRFFDVIARWVAVCIY